MRSLAMLAFAACAGSDTPADERATLVADNQIDCGGIANDSCFSANAGELAQRCLNDALASGGRAHFGVATLNSSWFHEDKDYFTVDHLVEVFLYYPDTGGDGTHDAGYTEKAGSCAGPFVVSEPAPCLMGGSGVGLSATGCP